MTYVLVDRERNLNGVVGGDEMITAKEIRAYQAKHGVGISEAKKTLEKQAMVKILDIIARDMEEDTKHFDSRQPFIGKTIVEYLGDHGAAIAVLVKIVKTLLR